MNIERISKVWFVGFALATLVAILMLVTGCSYNYGRNNNGTQPAPEGRSSQYSLINNTGLKLKIMQDGKHIGDVQPGEVWPIRGPLLWQRTVVIVTGYYPDDRYAGSASWIYQFGIPEVWTVHNLNTPLF